MVTQENGTLVVDGELLDKLQQLTTKLAVAAELRRLAERSLCVSTYAGDTLRTYSLRIITTALPDMITRETWRSWTDQGPTTDRQRDMDLLRDNGLNPCCPDCDRANLARLREQGVQAAPVPAPVPDEVLPDRTCECAACDEPHCQGDCEPCVNRQDCLQCRCDDAWECCGYCPECEDHHGEGREYVCEECDHCRDCDHYCGY
jgi:hypothetical protein